MSTESSTYTFSDLDVQEELCSALSRTITSTCQGSLATTHTHHGKSLAAKRKYRGTTEVPVVAKEGMPSELDPSDFNSASTGRYL